MSSDQQQQQQQAASSTVEFLRLVGRLKRTPRTGWGMQGVQDAESVAEHMYRAAMCAMLIPAEAGVDRDRCVKMALTHDLCEALAGDLTPDCGVAKAEKHRLEAEAMAEITSHVTDARLKAELNELWLEYEAGESNEARYVKDIDKFEMILQADEYERITESASSGAAAAPAAGAAPVRRLDTFFASTQGKFVTPLFQQLDRELRASRDARLHRFQQQL